MVAIWLTVSEEEEVGSEKDEERPETEFELVLIDSLQAVAAYSVLRVKEGEEVSNYYNIYIYLFINYTFTSFIFIASSIFIALTLDLSFSFHNIVPLLYIRTDTSSVSCKTLAH